MTEEKKTKPSLDQELNFDDLGGGTVKKKPRKKPEKKKDKITGYSEDDAGKVTTAGIVLGIPTDEKWYPDNTELKDIMVMSSKEFIKWAALVYPSDLSKYQEIFDKPDKRLKMFWKIVAFHKFSLFQLGKKNIDNSIKH